MSNVVDTLERDITGAGANLPDEPVSYKVCAERFERVKESLRILDDKLDAYNEKMDRIVAGFKQDIDTSKADIIAAQRELAVLQQWKANGSAKKSIDTKKTALWFSGAVLGISIIGNLDKIVKLLFNLVK